MLFLATESQIASRTSHAQYSCVSAESMLSESLSLFREFTEDSSGDSAVASPPSLSGLESLRSSFVSAAEGGERRASDDSGSAAAAACGTGPSAEAEGR